MRLIFLLCLSLFINLATADELPDPELISALKAAANDKSSFEDEFEAQVWLVDMSGRLARYKHMKDVNVRMDFLRVIHREAKRVELPPELILSVIHVESLFDRFAISVVGAQGYMQIMPFWKKEIGREDDNLFEMETNIRYGTTILAHYIKREKGNLPTCIGALSRLTGQGKIS